MLLVVALAVLVACASAQTISGVGCPNGGNVSLGLYPGYPDIFFIWSVHCTFLC